MLSGWSHSGEWRCLKKHGTRLCVFVWVGVGVCVCVRARVGIAARRTWPPARKQNPQAYAKVEPLRTVGLLEAAHQYSVQDVHGSARTPAPTHRHRC